VEYVKGRAVGQQEGFGKKVGNFQARVC